MPIKRLIDTLGATIDTNGGGVHFDIAREIVLEMAVFGLLVLAYGLFWPQAVQILHLGEFTRVVIFTAHEMAILFYGLHAALEIILIILLRWKI